jgi:hypothetical protein
MRTTSANLAYATSTREEIELFFGESHTEDMRPEDFRAQFKERIILNPVTAKHLAILLNNGIDDYEAKFGPLEINSSPPIEPGRHSALHPPLSKSDIKDEKAGLPLQLVKNLNVQYGFERSFKLFEKTLLANRFLLGFKKDTITQNPHEKILDICRQMDMPENFLETFQKNLPEANNILFGFEENEKNCVYKAYLEFGGRFEKLIKDNSNGPEELLIHLGFKWDASDNTRRAIARYTCFPTFSVNDMLERLSNDFYSQDYRTPFEIAEGILTLALSRAGLDELLYFEAQEENNPRKSFDINMYLANLRLTELYPLLLKMCRHYSIPSDIFHSLYDPVKTQIFGHLTGGIDREGRDFLTVYFGEKGSTR